MPRTDACTLFSPPHPPTKTHPRGRPGEGQIGATGARRLNRDAVGTGALSRAQTGARDTCRGGAGMVGRLLERQKTNLSGASPQRCCACR